MRSIFKVLFYVKKGSEKQNITKRKLMVTIVKPHTTSKRQKDTNAR